MKLQSINISSISRALNGGNKPEIHIYFNKARDTDVALSDRIDSDHRTEWFQLTMRNYTRVDVKHRDKINRSERKSEHPTLGLTLEVKNAF